MKKIVSIILSLLMLLSFAPFAANAEGEEKKEVTGGDLIEKYCKEGYEKAAKEIADAYNDGKVSKKDKEFIGLAISVVLRDDKLVKSHTEKAVKAGWTMDEFCELVSVCKIMGGEPGLIHAMDALKYAKDFGAKDMDKKVRDEKIKAMKKDDTFAFLSLKQREMISLGIALNVKCQACMKYHTEHAIDAGVTMEQLEEIYLINQSFAGGPSGEATRFSKDIAEKIFKEKTEKK